VPPSAAAAADDDDVWFTAIEAFFSRDWDARLCVLHAPSGRVVCLGVERGHCKEIESPAEAFHGEGVSAPARTEVQFTWRIPTSFLPDAVFNEIEEGLYSSDFDDDDSPTITNWDPVLGRNVAKTKGILISFSAYLKMMPGGPNASAEVWEWDYFRVVAEPQLTYSGCDDFEYSYMSERRNDHTDHVLQAFLHAATQVGAA
jgi:hypothetical protein